MRTLAALNVAVIGIGAFGELHCRTLAALDGFNLVAAVDNRKDRAESLAAELGIERVHSSLDDLIDDGCAEAVVIATRTHTHVPLALQALASGLNVLIEKPVGTDVSDVAKLRPPSLTGTPVIMAGHICLFHSLTVPLIERVRRRGWRAAHFVRHRSADTARLFAEEHPFRMTMIHDLYVLAQMANNDEPVSIEGWTQRNASGVPDMTWATLRWSDGRVATLQSHWTLPPGSPEGGIDWIEVFGDGYHTRIDTNPAPDMWIDERVNRPHGLEISSLAGRPIGMLAEELRSFAAACRGAAAVPPGCRISDALQVQEWISRLLVSADLTSNR